MSADTPSCQIHKKYEWIECANPALPGDPDGLCLLHSRDKEKDQDGAFTAAVKEKLDGEDYNFRGIFFPGQANFAGIVFKKDADFSYATFSDLALFSRATFSNDVVFITASFSDEADFHDAIFSGNAYFFLIVTFARKVNFAGVIIHEEKAVKFRGIRFPEEEEVIFRGANIFGRLIFETINKPAGISRRRFWRGDFIRISLGPKAILSFRDVSLAWVKFEGTDLKGMEFQNVDWHPLGWRFGWRQAVYEEILLGKNPSHGKYAIVEQLYRQLKTNYKNQEDFKRVGDFHYGEMEMHRRTSKWRWFPFYWYNLYWALSGYGERPSRALGWLAAFLAVFTGILAWAGLEILDPEHSAGFGNSFFYLLQKVTLQRPTWAEPMGFWGKLAAGFSVLLLPGQAALFILALRNRLGRRR